MVPGDSYWNGMLYCGLGKSCCCCCGRAVPEKNGNCENASVRVPSQRRTWGIDSFAVEVGDFEYLRKGLCGGQDYDHDYEYEYYDEFR